MTDSRLSVVPRHLLQRSLPLIAVLFLIWPATTCPGAARTKGPVFMLTNQDEAAFEETTLVVDLKRLASLRAALEDMAKEMEHFQATFTPHEKGYFSSK